MFACTDASDAYEFYILPDDDQDADWRIFETLAVAGPTLWPDLSAMHREEDAINPHGQTLEPLLAAPRRSSRSACAPFYRFVCVLFLLVTLISIESCHQQQSRSDSPRPTIEFTSVPTIGPNDVLGNPGKLAGIKGLVSGAQPGQQIVLYARALNDKGQLTWFVQPLVLRPFTRIQSNSKWRNSTHPGSEYAALLVEPGFQPPRTTNVLPTQGVVATAISQGWPPIWRNWWFPLMCLISAAAAALGLYRIWLHRVTRKLNLRFEERLAERTRIAQELHDTLLQGVISASMQLHVISDQLPVDSSAKLPLGHVLDLMGRVIEEGRNAVSGMRSPQSSAQDLGQELSEIHRDFAGQQKVGFHFIVEGRSRPIHPAIHGEIYSIGREALTNALRHSQADSVEVELEYDSDRLRLRVRDSGVGFDSKMWSFGRGGHWGLPGMRERAKRIGATLRVLSRPGAGTEVELTVPSRIAYLSTPLGTVSKRIGRWFSSGKEVIEVGPTEHH
jgi:signal transduction histidine kinase